MRIVVDLQGAQGTSRNRGIGRYSLSLALSIARNRGDHEVLIALNGQLMDSILAIREEFASLLPAANIVVWHSLNGTSSQNPDNSFRREAAECIREAFLASLQPDVVVISSLFEGWGDDCVTSVRAFGCEVKTAVVLYDLIPLIHRREYLVLPQLERWYDRKIFGLRRADLILGISDSSRKEGVDFLGIPDEITANISTAAEGKFRKISYPSIELERTLREIGISRPFLMYVSVPGYRKNHEGLIRAFSILPQSLRENFQLLLVCGRLGEESDRLRLLALQMGLSNDDIVLVGFVSDDTLVCLYNSCHLFVFPSWHEGFGLPALEAMSCGAAVIAADTSSLPEVVGNPIALFNSKDDHAIATKISQVLTDEKFRSDLIVHGLNQSKNFSWDKTGKDAILALERLVQDTDHCHEIGSSRKTLAFLSPLPPQKSGISDYSIDLLPELARHYNIDIVLKDVEIADPWILANTTVRTEDWFRKNSRKYDRILYHVGNSTFHEHMFSLICNAPGMVVLHDFGLTGIIAHMNGLKPDENILARELFHSHGYPALVDLFAGKDWEYLTGNYSCNRSLLEMAVGVVAHSKFSAQLARSSGNWVPENRWFKIPLLRASVKNISKAESRSRLGLKRDYFIVSTFGILGASKQSRRLLEVWLSTSMAMDQRCIFLFVGMAQEDPYCQGLIELIESTPLSGRVRITGWNNQEQFRDYLAATDVAVQLRSFSRGETSAAVLDCMNYGIPTIVNANGTMAELPDETVYKIPDQFTNDDLSIALERLYESVETRAALANSSRNLIAQTHGPRACADMYRQAIESSYLMSAHEGQALLAKIHRAAGPGSDSLPWANILQSVANNKILTSDRQVLVDISALINTDLRTGIQRVVRAILNEILSQRYAGHRIEPVYATLGQIGYKYARNYTAQFVGGAKGLLEDDPVSVRQGDIFLGLDLHQEIVRQQADFYQSMRALGAKVYFVVYDLLPILLPEVFPEGTDDAHSSWMKVVLSCDGALCISESVADEVRAWSRSQGKDIDSSKYNIASFHLGADVDNSVPTTGLPLNFDQIEDTLASRITYLMVGTIEPRKGYLQVMEAFETLWSKGVDTNLVIVGAEGWKGLPDEQRRTIPDILTKIRTSRELNKRLFWFGQASDEFLEKLYKGSDCLIAASDGEGFGLPLIEAAQYRLRVLCRDIPVFREIGGVSVEYFSEKCGLNLVDALLRQNEKISGGVESNICELNWLTWKESASQLMALTIRS